MVRGRRCLLGVFALLAACASEPQTSVRVCGDLRIPDDANALRVQLGDELMGEVRAGVFDLAPGDVVQPLPRMLLLPSRPETRWVTVLALLDGLEVARFDRHTGAVAEGAIVDAALTLTCYRVTCPRGQTCVDGVCDTAPGPGDAPRCGGP